MNLLRSLFFIPSILTCLTVAAPAAPAAAPSLVRRPYLQTVTPASVTLVWTTKGASNTQVRYGASPQSLTTTVTQSASVKQHEVNLTGLTPGTRYYYSVGTSTTTLAGADSDHWFETAPAADSPTRLRAWILGDSGYDDPIVRDVRDGMLGWVGDDRPHMLLHMGDMAYNSGTASQFTSNFFGNFDTILRSTVTWPTFGNHESITSTSSSQSGSYYTAFVLPKAGEAGGLASGTEAYYSFDYANVHFVVLNSSDVSRAPGGAMLTWLEADLAATEQEWLIAYWHHPPYSKGTHDSDVETRLIDMRENALPILEDAGVDLVLSGHSHTYERSYLVDGAYETPTLADGHILDGGDGDPLGDGPYLKPAGLTPHGGAVYVVAGHGAYVGGTGGHPLMYTTDIQSGSCILDVEDNRLTLVNVSTGSEVRDRFSIVKGTGLSLGAPDGDR